MMRLPTIVTLLILLSAILSAASADNSKDADAIGQSGSLRGAGTDTSSIHQSLLRAIEADELGEFDASDLVLVRMNLFHDVPRNQSLCYSNLSAPAVGPFVSSTRSRSLYLIKMTENWDFAGTMLKSSRLI